MSEAGRWCEWLRFGFHTHFPIALYGTETHRWYEYFMHTHGIQVGMNMQKRMRQVSERVVYFPRMSYHNDDTLMHTNSDADNDLRENSRSLQEIVPVALRYTPGQGVIKQNFIMSIKEYGNMIVALRRHRAKMTRVEGMPSSSSSSSSSSEDENEKEEEEDITKCCVCNEQMFNRAPSLMCITCEDINRRDMKRNRKEKKKQEKDATMPKLERIDNQDEESKQAMKNAIQNEKVKIENEQRLKLQNNNKENNETVTGVHYDVLGTV